jgi:hypothetical protein
LSSQSIISAAAAMFASSVHTFRSQAPPAYSTGMCRSMPRTSWHRARLAG